MTILATLREMEATMVEVITVIREEMMCSKIRVARAERSGWTQDMFVR